MDKKFKNMEIAGAVLSVALTFVFHFIFGWTGKNPVIGAISAVNESVWEHVKIIFFPFVILSAIEYFIIKSSFKRFLVAKTVAAVFIVLITIVFYYTYSGILGYEVLAVDIASAIAWAILAFVISCKLYISKRNLEKHYPEALIVLILLIGLMVLFTFLPPKIGLFMDTKSGLYGMP